MRAICVELTDERATVVLRPGWLARILGAHEFVVTLSCYREFRVGLTKQWSHVATGRPVDERAILRALEFRPTSARVVLPGAVVNLELTHAASAARDALRGGS